MQAKKLRKCRRPCLRSTARLAVLICGCNAMAFAQDESAPSQYGNWNVGHQVVQADTGANRPMDIDVWFPTGADTTELAPARYGLTASGTTMLSRMAFETDQVVSGQQFPLIVYAHGATGKSVDNTVFAESLASNGFVVATTTHLDGGVPLAKPSSSFERTQDVTSIIDVMFAKSGTEQDAFFGLIDEAAVGVAGHSFGGSTALAMAGGIETETRTVLPDERVRAIMPIAQGDPYGQSTDLSKVDVPTLLFVGNQDEFGENLFAPDQLVALASQDKFLAIVDGATHLDVGVSTLQQSEVLEIPVPADPVLGTPEFIFTLPLPVATEFSNGETLRLESLFGVSFFTEFLKGDDSFANVLTPSYVAQNEPLVEFTGFVDGQPLGVPEPGSFMLAAVALGGISFCARRHRRRRRRPNNHTPYMTVPCFDPGERGEPLYVLKKRQISFKNTRETCLALASQYVVRTNGKLSQVIKTNWRIEAMKCFSMVAILLLFLTSSGWSTPFFPFEETFDGPIDDDDPATWLSGGFPTTLTQTNGDLILSGPTQLATGEEGFSLGLTVVSKDGGLVMAGDTSAQAVFRVSAPNAFGSIYTRSQAGFPGNPGVPEDSDGGAYFGNIAGNGTLQVGSFSPPNFLDLETTLDPTTRDVVFQLDTIGNQVTASAWYADEPKPVSPPSITFTDSLGTRPPGVFGVSFGGFGDNATDVSVTFRSFTIVPEPSTLSLVVLGMLGLIGCRRRRLPHFFRSHAMTT